MVTPCSARLFGEPGERLDDAREACFRFDRAPIREHADDARARAFGNLESARRQPRLIGERVLGREGILLEALVYRRRIGQHALEQRRCDR